jgi:hypothetical protein
MLKVTAGMTELLSTEHFTILFSGHSQNVGICFSFSLLFIYRADALKPFPIVVVMFGNQGPMLQNLLRP